MPNASAGSVRACLELKKNGNKAKDFQKFRVEEWLNNTIEPIPLSDNR